MHALYIGKDRKVAIDKEPLINQVHPTLSGEAKNDVTVIDLTVTFVDPAAAVGDESEKMLEGVPPVRVILPEHKD